jgi:anaerobic dimethyl sulfoxide reductase subunit B (iron-sulfur subunit)
MEHAIYVDIKRCTGCMACTVACMDQNDLNVERGDGSWRQVYKVEEGSYPEVKVSYVSLACVHCQDAPCAAACPTEAIGKKENGMVYVSADICIGCHNCLLVCPFGIPRFGKDGKMQKCTLCIERVEEGLEPACVRVCPTRALKFGPVNALGNQVEKKAAERIVRSATSPIAYK